MPDTVSDWAKSPDELEETYVDDDGLRIPPALREFGQQVVFRTPLMTIQHFGNSPLKPFYGGINKGHFGDVDDPQNPQLLPNQVSIKRAGEDPVILEVDTDVTVP